MTRQRTLDRRRFLWGAAAASVATLAACSPAAKENPSTRSAGGGGAGTVRRKGSATKALPQPRTFAEAPALATQVKAKQLPPVKDRLPAHPYVVPHRWVGAGKYGGTLRMLTSDTTSVTHKEYMYGHSILRWLNDGRDVGPGLAESWETNDEATEWTFHFRSGLRWSDGKPWSTKDIMFWWQDMVLNEDHPESPPDEAKSSNGTLMKLTAPDDDTLVMTYDSPAPLTPFHLARWVNGGVGPAWMAPKHYLAQFHPTYNKQVGKDWATERGDFDAKRDWAINADCPTMTGWRLATYREGTNLTLERNPYYWCVDAQGHQLPFIDTLELAAVEDPEVAKLQMREGKVDYVHGPFASLTLRDVSGLKQSAKRSALDVVLWDGGSGTGSIFFFDYDYREPAVRELIRKPAFRQALSLAVDRDEMQKALYFGTGTQTTGTYSPKALDFTVDAQARSAYASWRDSYRKHDPAKAKTMLDDLGVVDADGDGVRELPGGGRLVVRLDYPADASEEHLQKNNLLVRDWKAIGIEAKQNPVPPAAWAVQWQAGELMSTTAWENGGGIHEILVEPQVLVPLSGFADWWAPMHANFHALRGTPEAQKVKGTDPYKRTPPSIEPEPGGPIERLWDLHDRAKAEPDAVRRYKLVWEMVKIHVEDGPFFMGTVANTPYPMLFHRDLRNFPKAENLALDGFAGPWSHPTPAVYDPETWFWTNPDQHPA